MKISEIRFGCLFRSKATQLILWGWSLACFLLILCSGCSSINRNDALRATMLDNTKYWEQRCAILSPGQVVHPLPPIQRPGIRVFEMKWDDAVETSELLLRMQRVTHDGLDLDNLSFNEAALEGKKVKDLPPAEQNRLRALWEKRITEALTTKYFDVAPDLLAEGLRRDELVFYYLLVGRHNSPEMGHSDVVKMLCVNSKGHLVVKVRERYGASYPLGFIEQRGTPSKYLF